MCGMEEKMKKIIVTGSTSFIGKRFVEIASENGYEIIAVARCNSKKTEDLKKLDNVNVIELNMNEYDRLGKIVGKSDCLLHLAWNGTRGTARMDGAIQQDNYKNSIKAVKSVLDAGCNKIILAGSQAEYGITQGKISEESICAPNTAYGKYKLKVYNTVKQICEENNVDFKEPRIFSLYGVGDYENTLIMSLLRKMKKNEPCEMTECIQKWDYLYIDDAADALLTLCTTDCPSGVYNLASGDIRTLKEYVEEMYSILDSKSELIYGAIAYPQSGIVNIEPLINKIVLETGWHAKITFKKGIESMWKNRRI